MAEVTHLRRGPGAWGLRRLDVRLKLALLAAASLVSLRLGFAGIGLLALPLAAVLLAVTAVSRPRFREVRWVFVLLGFVFAARVLSTDGPPIVAIGAAAISREGLREGALVSLRLALVFMSGAAFIATTRSAEIKAGVEWLCRPLPQVPAARVATMLSLVVRFMPVIVAQAAKTTDAQRARAVENRKNPVYRTVKFAIPLMRRIFETADGLALAMEARCYCEQRTDPEIRAGLRDWVVFAAGAAILAAAWLL